MIIEDLEKNVRLAMADACRLHTRKFGRADGALHSEVVAEYSKRFGRPLDGDVYAATGGKHRKALSYFKDEDSPFVPREHEGVYWVTISPPKKNAEAISVDEEILPDTPEQDVFISPKIQQVLENILGETPTGSVYKKIWDDYRKSKSSRSISFDPNYGAYSFCCNLRYVNYSGTVRIYIKYFKPESSNTNIRPWVVTRIISVLSNQVPVPPSPVSRVMELMKRVRPNATMKRDVEKSLESNEEKISAPSASKQKGKLWQDAFGRGKKVYLDTGVLVSEEFWKGLEGAGLDFSKIAVKIVQPVLHELRGYEKDLGGLVKTARQRLDVGYVKGWLEIEPSSDDSAESHFVKLVRNAKSQVSIVTTRDSLVDRVRNPSVSVYLFDCRQGKLKRGKRKASADTKVRD